MIRSLQRHPEEGTCAPPKRRPKGLPRRSGAKAGWTPERRARASARARETQPWRHATGPRSETGKARSALNGLKHGYRSRAHIMQMRLARHILRLSARNIAIVRTYLRLRRLEHRLADRPQTLESVLKLKALRDALARLTSAPLPRFAAEINKNSDERTDGGANPPERPSTCQEPSAPAAPVMLFPEAGVKFGFAARAPGESHECRSQLGI